MSVHRLFEMNDFERSLIEGEDIGIMSVTSSIKDAVSRASEVCRFLQLHDLEEKLMAIQTTAIDSLDDMSKEVVVPKKSPGEKDDRFVWFGQWYRVESRNDDIKEFRRRYFEIMKDFANDLKVKARKFPWVDAKRIIDPFLKLTI